MKDIVIFGAGEYGKKAAISSLAEGKRVVCFVDNDENKIGSKVINIPVISLNDFIKDYKKYKLVIAVNIINQEQIKKQLESVGVTKYQCYDFKRLSEKERIVAYTRKDSLEDVLLYHVLKYEDEIFYIDVGSNDQFEDSVTKLLYDMKNARGINIEPQKGFHMMTEKERPRDINLCIGVGNKREKKNLYYQDLYSTVVEENVINKDDCYVEEIDIITLKEICDMYLDANQNISFLKIDVEGAEKSVLEGCDFKKYRPWIIEIESTMPGTDIPIYENWEMILLANGYHFVQILGRNRFYVADERSDLDTRFCSLEDLCAMYYIYNAKLM